MRILARDMGDLGDIGDGGQAVLPGLLGRAPEVLRIPSMASRGTAELCQYLCEEVLKELPVKRELIPATESDRPDFNLLASFEPGEAGPGLLLVTHLDTVEPGESALWTETGGDPFSPTIKEGRLYGLGSADTKLDWLCKAEALRLCVEEGDLRAPVHLLGTFGEETGMTGATQFIGSSPLPHRPTAVFIGEPTNLVPVNRTKGRILVDLTFRWPAAPLRPWWLRPARFFGQSAHASRPDLGANAANKALSALPPGCTLLASIAGGDAENKVPAGCQLLVDADNAELLSRIAVAGAEIEAARVVEASAVDPQALEAAKEAVAAIDDLVVNAARQDNAFSPPTPTTCLTGIESRRGELSIRLDVRLLPGQSSSALVEEIRKQISLTWSTREMLAGEVSLLCESPALDLAEESEIVVRARAILRRLGLPDALATKPGCTEAGLFIEAGIPALVLGPGLSYGNIHAPNEFNSIEQLITAVTIYQEIIRDFCS